MMRPRGLGLAVVLLWSVVQPATGQSGETIRLRSSEGSTVALSVAYDRGYATLPMSTFEGLGWSTASDGRTIALRGPEGTEVVLRAESPFFRWDDEILQATDPPYQGGGATMLPLQLLTDFLPHRLPDLYGFDPVTGTLTIQGSGFESPPVPASAPTDGRATPASVTGPGAVAETEPPSPPELSPYEGPRVVVIDAGHGGIDPGTLGPGGIVEKDIALGIANELADILRQDPDLEVHETREDDSLVPLWDRGDLATEAKGDRPGVFVSIHANSSPQRRQVRGFETYFLSEARTEHERRVAAIENAPLQIEQIAAREEEPDLGFILRELRTLDDQHWSALLAEFVQKELETFHPGPNRGVKQGLLAVLTNALMPSVLVEVGYLSHAEEARLLDRESFQHDAAAAIARAITSFFERYPPGSGWGG